MSVRAFAEDFELNRGAFRSWLYMKTTKQATEDNDCNLGEVEAAKVRQ